MDISIYTGRVSEKDFREERPLEWERLHNSGELSNYKIKSLSVFEYVLAYLWGILTLLTGLFLLVLIFIGQFTAR
jgi:hypothetical protein